MNVGISCRSHPLALAIDPEQRERVMLVYRDTLFQEIEFVWSFSAEPDH